jgi:Uncharacterized protein conserved in bacteria
VNDQATSLAIRELYRQLKKDNMTKAKALQNAQKSSLQCTDTGIPFIGRLFVDWELDLNLLDQNKE